jgi:tetratricopeptide (TPR) repeat protein
MRPVWRPILTLIGVALIGTAVSGFLLKTGEWWEPAMIGVGAVLILVAWFGAPGPAGRRGTASGADDRQLRDLVERAKMFETPDLLGDIAALHLERDEIPAAQPVLMRALELAPNDPRLNYLAGQVWFEAGDPAGAWEHFDRVFRKDPDYDKGEVRLWAARTYLALGDVDPALQLTDRFLESEPGHLRALLLRGETLSAAGRAFEARVAYLELMQAYNRAPAFHRDRYRHIAVIARKRLRQ